MMRDIVFLGRSLLIFVYVHGITGDTDSMTDLFQSDTALDGFKCSDNYAVDVPSISGAETVAQCALSCVQHFECIGVYYKSDDNTCELCNHLFKAADINSLEAMAGSKYYSRNVCRGRVYGKKNLRVFMQEVTFGDAETMCHETGGQLMRIRDLAEVHQITDALYACSSYRTVSNFWTDGILDPLFTGTWKYSDGTLMPMTQDYWHEAAPDMNHHCTRLQYWDIYDKVRWNDYACTSLYGFVCEY